MPCEVASGDLKPSLSAYVRGYFKEAWKVL
jgi:hypothetical protein